MKKIDTSRIKTYSVKGRESKVRTGDFAQPHQKGSSFKDFFSSLPNILASRHFKDVVAAIVQARKDKRPVMLGMGAHAINLPWRALKLGPAERVTVRPAEPLSHHRKDLWKGDQSLHAEVPIRLVLGRLSLGRGPAAGRRRTVRHDQIRVPDRTLCARQRKDRVRRAHRG